jgi:uncharacterized protein YbjT (DUF2867 family)
MAARLVAVTGATGFLGRHLARELAADGWRVRVLARRDVIHPLWRELEVEVVLGDLADASALDRLCRDAELVVHCAGLTKAWTAAAFNAVNVEGTRRVAERATGRMLLVSSLSAREPGLSDYAASKRAGEEAARAVLGQRITVVRPPALYGPGDPETLPLFKLAASSPVLPLLGPEARIAMMHVQDAARQIAAIAKLSEPFEISLADNRPDGYRWREVLQTAANVFGRTPKCVRIPQLALHLAAAAGRLASRSGPAPMISFGKVREISHPDWSVRPNEQPLDLPAPRYDLANGFLHSVQGYQASGVNFGKSVTISEKMLLTYSADAPKYATFADDRSRGTYR